MHEFLAWVDLTYHIMVTLDLTKQVTPLSNCYSKDEN